MERRCTTLFPTLRSTKTMAMEKLPPKGTVDRPIRRSRVTRRATIRRSTTSTWTTTPGKPDPTQKAANTTAKDTRDSIATRENIFTGYILFKS